jgi:zinc transport system ATP-binding protein
MALLAAGIAVVVVIAVVVAKSGPEPADQAPAAELEDVTVTLGGSVILDGVSAGVPPGSCTAIVGPNGAGKTTMLLALLGHLPCQGRLRVTREAEGPPPRMGYVPQRLQFDRRFPRTKGILHGA